MRVFYAPDASIVQRVCSDLDPGGRTYRSVVVDGRETVMRERGVMSEPHLGGILRDQIRRFFADHNRWRVGVS